MQLTEGLVRGATAIAACATAACASTLLSSLRSATADAAEAVTVLGIGTHRANSTRKVTSCICKGCKQVKNTQMICSTSSAKYSGTTACAPLFHEQGV
jgi:hypothetical protein